MTPNEKYIAKISKEWRKKCDNCGLARYKHQTYQAQLCKEK